MGGDFVSYRWTLMPHMSPIQDDMHTHSPQIHHRLRQSTPADRVRIGKDLLALSPTPVSAKTPSSTSMLRRSKRRTNQPNRLTTDATGHQANSKDLPLPLVTHTPNKANIAKLRERIVSSANCKAWKAKHQHKPVTLNMVSMITNVVMTYSATMSQPNVHERKM